MGLMKWDDPWLLPGRYPDIAWAFQDSLQDRFSQQSHVMYRAWLQIHDDLSNELDSLVDYFAKTSAKDWSEDFLVSKVYNAERYQQFINQVYAEMAPYVHWVENDLLVDEMKNVIRLGNQMALTASESIPQFRGVFDVLHRDAIQNIVAQLTSEETLGPILKRSYAVAYDAIGRELMKNVALGLNPREIAKFVKENGLDQSFNHLLLVSRDQQIRAYRQAYIQTYQNSGVVTGLKRLAAKNSRTCYMCLALDGYVYPLDPSGAVPPEIELHPQDRCAFVPVTDFHQPTWADGQSWFDQQPESVQKEILGPGRMEMYKQGLGLDEMTGFVQNDTWGASPVQIPLKSLRPPDHFIPTSPSGKNYSWTFKDPDGDWNVWVGKRDDGEYEMWVRRKAGGKYREIERKRYLTRADAFNGGTHRLGYYTDGESRAVAVRYRGADHYTAKHRKFPKYPKEGIRIEYTPKPPKVTPKPGKLPTGRPRTAQEARERLVELKEQMRREMAELRGEMDKIWDRKVGLWDDLPDDKKAEYNRLKKLYRGKNDELTQRALEEVVYVDPKDRLKVWMRTDSPQQRVGWRTGADQFGNMLDKNVWKPPYTGANHVKYKYTRKGRSFFSNEEFTVYMSEYAGKETSVHELGHWMERMYPESNRQARLFRTSRTKGESAQWLGRGYDKSEVAKVDKFFDPYCGKIYDHGSTEIISMGMERMATAPLTFALEDPDYFDFIYDLCRGIFRFQPKW